MSAPVIEVSNLNTVLAGKVVHRGLNLTIEAGEKIAIIGSSGCGKTTLVRSILMLLKPKSGTINVFGINVTDCTEEKAREVQSRWGVMFQGGALFSSLTVLENVMFPMQEDTEISQALMQKIALFKIALVGLGRDAVMKYPSELSGGMKKRASMARAIALDPELVFLDEPTSGLDPKSASEFDSFLLQLHQALNLTIVMITHDLDTLWRVPDRVVFLGEGKVLAACPMAELVKNKHPIIKDYFDNVRAKEFGGVGVGDG